MKHSFLLLILAGLLASCGPASPGNVVPDTRVIDEARQRRITELESQIEVQRHSNDHWQLITVCLGIGCVALLILGTSLGAKTRHDAALS